MIHRVCALGSLALLAALAGCDSQIKVEPPMPKRHDRPRVELQPVAVQPAKEASVAAKVTTHRVEKGPFKIEVALKGIFEAKDMTAISLARLDAWSPQNGGQLIVKQAVEHGTAVHKGDILLALDLDKIDRTIHDVEADLQQSTLAIKQAEEELPLLEKSAPLELAAAERAKKVADEDLKHFVAEGRPNTEKRANFAVKVDGQWLAYAKEELRQLEKMYRSKDLTEETEEMILKRQRNTVEMYEFFLRSAEIERDYLLKTSLPRQEQVLNAVARKLDLDLQKTKITQPSTLAQKRLALNKLKYDQDKSTTRLAALKKDRDAMTIKATTDGIVYHGRCVRGQWSTGGDKLNPGNTLQGPDVLLTVVKARPLFVRAVVEEKDLRWLRPGLEGKVTPAAFPDLRLPAKVEAVSAVPISADKFDARLTVALDKDSDALMPGMACTVKLVPYQNAEAVTVPLPSVFRDELDEARNFVLVPTKDGKAEKRFVTLGKRNERQVEVTDGLKAGEEILPAKPEKPMPVAPPAKEAKP